MNDCHHCHGIAGEHRATCPEFTATGWRVRTTGDVWVRLVPSFHPSGERANELHARGNGTVAIEVMP